MKTRTQPWLAAILFCAALVVFCTFTAHAAFYVNVANAQRYGVRSQYGPFATYAAAQAFINQNDPSFRPNMSISGSADAGGNNNGGGYSGPSQADIAAQQAAAAQKKLKDEAFDLNNQGIDAYNRHDYETALKYFQDALEKSPDDVNIATNVQNAKDQIAAKKQREQEAFDKSKQEGLSQLRGIGKSGGENSDSGLKGIGSSDSGLKGIGDNPMGLKDAVADNSGSKKLFTNKKAIEDALTASAHGKAGIGALANYFPNANATFNPVLEDALTSAKAETDQKFAQRLVNDRHFDTVVLANDSGAPNLSPAQPVRVPDALKNDPRFQKLVIEHDALQHQSEVIEKQIQTIKADPAYAQDRKTLTKVDQLQIALQGVQGMEGYVGKVTENVIAKPTTISSVDFGDPPPKRGLDSGNVPSPTQ
jgi:hypothetical protein